MELGIDTSTENLSIALFDSGEVVGSFDEMSKMRHGANLIWQVDQLLSQHGILHQEIQGLVSGRGPGSYTGLRVGITACKMWAAAKGVPLYQVSSLALMAARVGETNRVIIPLMDARRMSCYVGAYQVQEGKVVALWKDQHADWQEWLHRYQSHLELVTLVGKDIRPFVEKFKELLPQVDVEVRDGDQYLPQIKNAYRTQIQGVDDPDLFEPYYGQVTLAEREWIEKSGSGDESHEHKWVEITRHVHTD